VASVTGTNVVLTVDQAPAITTAVGTMKLVKANFNIQIEGGLWDYDTANNPSVGSYQNMGFRFNFIRKLQVRNLSVMRSSSYAMHTLQSHDCTYSGLFIRDTFSDGCHFDGMALNPLVENMRGQTGDDFVAFTNFQAVPAGVYAYILPPSWTPGRITNAVIRDIAPGGCKAAVKLALTAGWDFRGVSISGVKGFGDRAALSYVDDGVDLTGGGGSSLFLSDVNYTSKLASSAIAEVQTTGTLTDFTLEGISHNIPASIAVLIAGPVNTVNLRGVKIASAMTVPFMRVNVANVGVINFSDVDGLSAAGGMLLTTEGNTYTVSQVNIDNITWTSSSATGYVIYNNGGAAQELTELNVNNFRFVGGGAGVGIFCAVNAGLVRRANFSNGTMQSSGLIFTYTAGAVANAPVFKLNNVEFATVNRYCDLRYGGTVLINNVRSSGLTSQPIFAGGTSQTYVVKAASWQHGLTEVFGFGTTPVITCYGWDIVTDPVASLATTTGQFLTSSQAATEGGPCVRYTGQWVALGTGASGVNTVIT